MSAPTLCMVYDAIGDSHASIPNLAKWEVQQALEKGWQVTCVCRDLDESLRGHVEHLPLHIPPKAFAVKWLSARRNIRNAIGGRTFDVIHAHQPQIAALSDVMQCHFLTRAAARYGGLEGRAGLKRRVARAQQELILRAEDAYWRQLVKSQNPVHLLFVSPLLRDEFTADYGTLACPDVLLNMCPAPDFPSDEERQAARAEWAPEAENKLILGYLGGVDTRKGYRELLGALENEGDREIFLLMGGPSSENWDYAPLQGRFKAVGLLDDLKSFFAACDAFIVPSRFDPCPLIVGEAAARGVPVIATPKVGGLPTLLECGAGVGWQAGEPLSPIVRDVAARRLEFNAGAKRMCETFSSRHQADRLLDIYQEIAARKQAAAR